MHDGDWVLIAAASHDWTELLNLIAILVLGLISGAVTLIKRYLDNKQQQKEKESKSGEGGIVPGVLVDDEAPARRAGARPAQGTAPPQRPLPQSPVPVATSVPGAVPPRVTSPVAKSPTGSLKTTVKSMGPALVGSAWPAAWSIVTVGGSTS